MSIVAVKGLAYLNIHLHISIIFCTLKVLNLKQIISIYVVYYLCCILSTFITIFFILLNVASVFYTYQPIPVVIVIGVAIVIYIPFNEDKLLEQFFE